MIVILVLKYVKLKGGFFFSFSAYALITHIHYAMSIILGLAVTFSICELKFKFFYIFKKFKLYLNHRFYLASVFRKKITLML